jgi:hypothetical protein
MILKGEAVGIGRAQQEGWAGPPAGAGALEGAPPLAVVVVGAVVAVVLGAGAAD